MNLVVVFLIMLHCRVLQEFIITLFCIRYEAYHFRTFHMGCLVINQNLMGQTIEPQF